MNAPKSQSEFLSSLVFKKQGISTHQGRLKSKWTQWMHDDNLLVDAFFAKEKTKTPQNLMWGLYITLHIKAHMASGKSVQHLLITFHHSVIWYFCNRLCLLTKLKFHQLWTISLLSWTIKFSLLWSLIIPVFFPCYLYIFKVYIQKVKLFKHSMIYVNRRRDGI